MTLGYFLDGKTGGTNHATKRTYLRPSNVAAAPNNGAAGVVYHLALFFWRNGRLLVQGRVREGKDNQEQFYGSLLINKH